jgi:hypothetical protein
MAYVQGMRGEAMCCAASFGVRFATDDFLGLSVRFSLRLRVWSFG